MRISLLVFPDIYVRTQRKYNQVLWWFHQIMHVVDRLVGWTNQYVTDKLR